MKVFLEETGIWIGELNKAEGLLQCGWAWSDLLKAQIEKKSEEMLREVRAQLRQAFLLC